LRQARAIAAIAKIDAAGSERLRVGVNYLFH
jgi:hypothetical protein